MWFNVVSERLPLDTVLGDLCPGDEDPPPDMDPAMTVEAVPRVDAQGEAIAPATLRLMHTTMQTLGRVAIIGGGVFVSLLNVLLFQDVDAMPESDKVATYIQIYTYALAIPVNVPLGLALTEFIGETSIPTIAHHHDFYWERTRFVVNAVGDYLRMAFPPKLPGIEHVVINSAAQEELALRTGISSIIIPNVLDFEGLKSAVGFPEYYDEFDRYNS